MPVFCTLRKEVSFRLIHKFGSDFRLIFENPSHFSVIFRPKKVKISMNVFPSQIETVLLNQGYPANYQIIVDRMNHTDTLDVQVEMTPEMFTDNMGEITQRQKKLVEGLRNMLGLTAKVTLVAPKSIVRSEGKAVRVIDKRKI